MKSVYLLIAFFALSVISCDSGMSDALFIFTVDDIETYHIETGEIVCKGLIFQKLIMLQERGKYERLALYYHKKPLFDDIKMIRGPWQSNPWYGYIVLQIRDGNIFQLINKADQWQREFVEFTIEKEENAKNLNAAWDKFINYLNDAGKIVR